MKEKKQSVLLIDGDKRNRAEIKAAISEEYDIIEAVTGEIGITLAEKETPDIILVEVCLPLMDGYSVCHLLKHKRSTRRIPIIFLLNSTDPREKSLGLEIGATDCVSNPINKEELISRIDKQIKVHKYARLLEEQMQARTQQLIHSDRLATLGLFAAGLAHEINNPNTFISGNVQTLRDFWILANPILTKHADENAEILKYLPEIDDILDGIQEGSRRISVIINSSKSHAREIDTPNESTSLLKIINEALILLRHLAKDDLIITVDVPAELKILCNSQKISQVFVNLIGNAIDAMGHSGEVKISAIQEIDRITIKVKDTGPGIPPKALERIFDPFFTTKGSLKGTGLGLYIVKEIIDENEGIIFVSQTGTMATTGTSGTEFTIILPIINKG